RRRPQRGFPARPEPQDIRSRPADDAADSRMRYPGHQDAVMAEGRLYADRLLRQPARARAGRRADQRRLQRRPNQGARRLHPDQFHETADAHMVRSVITAFILLLASTALAGAADFEVDMVNKAADGTMMAFDPPLTRVAVGDTVTFVAK